MQRTYEVMYILRPDMAEDEMDKLIGTLESNAGSAGATVKNTERMGKRRLAYLVSKFNDGFYVLMTVDADGKAIHEVERRLRVTEPVMKFITVRVDESAKRKEKMAALRATKVKRSTQQQQQQQAPMAEAAPAATAAPVAAAEAPAAEAAPEAAAPTA